MQALRASLQQARRGQVRWQCSSAASFRPIIQSYHTAWPSAQGAVLDCRPSSSCRPSSAGPTPASRCELNKQAQAALSLSAALSETRGCAQLTVRDALNSALDDELARDENVFVLGEEVRAASGCAGSLPGCLSDMLLQVGEYQGAYKVCSVARGQL